MTTHARDGRCLYTSSKSEIPDKISTLLKQLQAQHPARKIAFIRLDGAKEYTQGAFKNTISDMGCSFEISAPYRQAQNGVAEARIGLTWKMSSDQRSEDSLDQQFAGRNKIGIERILGTEEGNSFLHKITL